MQTNAQGLRIVFKLKKALYGLPDTGQCWNHNIIKNHLSPKNPGVRLYLCPPNNIYLMKILSDRGMVLTEL